jgi:DNA-binding response OmpR family regulator
VDDHADLRDSIGILLQHQGYLVADAANGVEALDYLRSEQPVHAIILDLVMPVMDGWQFLSHWRTREAWTQIPMLVLTGVPLSRIRQKELGDVMVLTKPFTFAELMAAMRTL